MRLLKSTIIEFGAEFLFFMLICVAWAYLPANDSPEYFLFVDQRNFLGIPNALDVLSNLGFLFVGLHGYLATRKNKTLPEFYSTMGYIISAAIILTFFGSSYFHLQPNTERLFWDRLPMSIAFGGIVTLLSVDRLNVKRPQLFGWIVIGGAMLSVIGWRLEWFNLKPYLVTQFGSIIYSVAIISLKRNGFVENRPVWMCIGFYAIAKLLEHYDAQIYSLGEVISGHSLKHIVAAVGIYYLFGFIRHKKNKIN